MVDTSRLADALLGYQVPSEDAQFPYPSLADALASSDAGARTQIYGPKGTLARDKADFSAQVHSGLQNYLSGAQAMVPQTNERAAEMAAYATPILGNALSARDAYEAAKQGDWRGTALGAIGAVPMIGGIFAGVGAKTADRAALARAQEMAAAGRSAEDIWHGTGWFTGADGKWRFEIPDSKAYYDPEALAELKANAKDEGRHFDPVRDATTVGGAIGHGALYGAYPQFSDAPLHFLPRSELDGAAGAYASKSGRVTLSDGLDNNKALSYGLHELQHGIQHAEGFATGANPNDKGWQARYGALRQQAAESDAVMQMQGRVNHLGESPAEAAQYIAEVRNMDPERLFRLYIDYPGQDMADRMSRTREQLRQYDPNELYRRSAGEVEARNVQARINMTPEERQTKPPWATQDVPNNQQIVRFR